VKSGLAFLSRGVASRLEAGRDDALNTLFEAMPPALLVGRDRILRRANRRAQALLPAAEPGAVVSALFAEPDRAIVTMVLDGAFGAAAHGATSASHFHATSLAEADGRISAVLLHVGEAVAGPRQASLQRLQALGALVGGIAHDVNNLLTAIRAAGDAIAESPDAAAAEIAQIRAATSRGAGLVRQLLAFGRQQTLQPRPVAINAAVTDVSAMLRRLIGEAIEVAITLEEPGRNVHVDPVQLDQVLINLAINARDAMPQGGQLRLTTGHATLVKPEPGFPEPVPPGRWVTVAVADSGEGIADTVLPRIFEPFFTTRGTAGSSLGGAGLGLATVHGILRQSGGYLTVQTALGAGTTMTVYLPRWNGAVAQAAPPAAAVTAGGAGQLVLLVEDEEMIRKPAERTLTRRGWRVLSADSAEAALVCLDSTREPIAAVISDIVMPGMDGPSLVRAIRARAGYGGLPAILVSGYAPDSQRDTLTGMEAQFLAKPYTMQELAERLAAILPQAGR
jgi:two-component system cell cycle sensor histidine kinase/response regulator CckA